MTLKRIDKPKYKPVPLFDNGDSNSLAYDQRRMAVAAMKRALTSDFHAIVRRTGNEDLLEADVQLEQLRPMVPEQEFEEFKAQLHKWAAGVKKFDGAYDKYAFDMPDLNSQRIAVWSVLVSFMAAVMVVWGIVAKNTMARNGISFPIFNTLEETLAWEEAHPIEKPCHGVCAVSLILIR